MPRYAIHRHLKCESGTLNTTGHPNGGLIVRASAYVGRLVPRVEELALRLNAEHARKLRDILDEYLALQTDEG